MESTNCHMSDELMIFLAYVYTVIQRDPDLDDLGSMKSLQDIHNQLLKAMSTPVVSFVTYYAHYDICAHN